MATELDGLCIGQYQASRIVVTRLDDDCTPLTGDEAQARTRCFTSVDATPEYEDGKKFGRPAADGVRCFYVQDCKRITQWNLTFSILTWDWELIELMTSSALAIGKAGGPWEDQVIGIYAPGPDSDCPAGISTEVYVKAAPKGAGGICAEAGAGFPSYVRHLFPFMRANLGQLTLDDNEDGILLNMEGFSLPNPNWGSGPANNWEGTTVPTDTPYAAVFSNTLPSDECGYASAVA